MGQKKKLLDTWYKCTNGYRITEQVFDGVRSQILYILYIYISRYISFRYSGSDDIIREHTSIRLPRPSAYKIIYCSVITSTKLCASVPATTKSSLVVLSGALTPCMYIYIRVSGGFESFDTSTSSARLRLARVKLTDTQIDRYGQTKRE